MPGNWEGSTRRDTLPANWATEIRPAVIARDKGRCRWIQNNARCPAPGTDVDHIGYRDDHRLVNLRLLCREHHNRRSSAQGNAAQAAWRTRNVEAHPAYS